MWQEDNGKGIKGSLGEAGRKGEKEEKARGIIRKEEGAGRGRIGKGMARKRERDWQGTGNKKGTGKGIKRDRQGRQLKGV